MCDTALARVRGHFPNTAPQCVCGCCRGRRRARMVRQSSSNRACDLRLARVTTRRFFLRHDKQMSFCVTTNRFLLRHDWPDDKTRKGYAVPCISRATSSGLRVSSDDQGSTRPSTSAAMAASGSTSLVSGVRRPLPGRPTRGHFDVLRTRTPRWSCQSGYGSPKELGSMPTLGNPHEYETIPTGDSAPMPHRRHFVSKESD